MVRRILRLGGAVFVAAALPTAAAFPQSPASRNNAGNRLFEQGKYQEAERVYLEAQASMPGKPELSYNLGNALMKQKKYDQALQSLHQALAGGEKPLQAHGWYNAGNALYEMGRYQDAAHAYIESLRLNSSDPDAKHNLELALKQAREQRQGAQNSGGKQDGSRVQGEQAGNQQARPREQGAEQASRTEAGISRERALQILDALKNQELADQRRVSAQPVQRRISARDW